MGGGGVTSCHFYLDGTIELRHVGDDDIWERWLCKRPDTGRKRNERPGSTALETRFHQIRTDFQACPLTCVSTDTNPNVVGILETSKKTIPDEYKCKVTER